MKNFIFILMLLPQIVLAANECEGEVFSFENPGGTRESLRCSGTWTDEFGRERKCRVKVEVVAHQETRKYCVCSAIHPVGLRIVISS